MLQSFHPIPTTLPRRSKCILNVTDGQAKRSTLLQHVRDGGFAIGMEGKLKLIKKVHQQQQKSSAAKGDERGRWVYSSECNLFRAVYSVTNTH